MTYDGRTQEVVFQPIGRADLNEEEVRLLCEDVTDQEFEQIEGVVVRSLQADDVITQSVDSAVDGAPREIDNAHDSFPCDRGAPGVAANLRSTQ
jgi:hypothetical protein